MPDLEGLRPVTLMAADQLVYQALRDEIVRGLPPGTPLQLRDLADRFSVSTMPIRSALDRLQRDGLVVQQPRRGAFVAPLDRDDLLDIQTIRVALEGRAARLGADVLPEESVVWMRTEMDTLLAEWERGKKSLDRYLEATVAIHRACYDATKLPKLLQLINAYRLLAERYLRVALDEADDLDDDLDRQVRFVEACEARDPAAAEEAVHTLLMWTVDRVTPMLTPG